jgi:MptA/FolE2 family GTP cyclohydrolase
MNTRDKTSFLPDIQSQVDHRDLRIDAAGVKDVRYPMVVRSGGNSLPTVATLTMTVGLPATAKGTHMSRFIELLEANDEPVDPHRLKAMLADMLDRLQAESGAIELRFPYFMQKTAPVSGVQSLLDCEVCWRGAMSEAGQYTFSMQVKLAATSLCPCSKEISDYGAHNQRSHITIGAELAGDVTIEELVAVGERSASCEVYGLLKRIDEKHVTERAFENPKFVEDLARDVALALNRDPRIRDYVVEIENFESIHNHSAFARIARAK